MSYYNCHNFEVYVFDYRYCTTTPEVPRRQTTDCINESTTQVQALLDGFSMCCYDCFLYWHRKDVNSSPPGQNGRLFADNIFWCIFMSKKFCILVIKFVPEGPLDNNPALAQIMAWCWIGDKPLSEPMMTCFTNAYMGTRGRWVNA